MTVANDRNNDNVDTNKQTRYCRTSQAIGNKIVMNRIRNEKKWSAEWSEKLTQNLRSGFESEWSS